MSQAAHADIQQQPLLSYPDQMRTFALVTPSGPAEGVRFSDGRVALLRQVGVGSLEVYPTVADLRARYGPRAEMSWCKQPTRPCKALCPQRLVLVWRPKLRPQVAREGVRFCDGQVVLAWLGEDDTSAPLEFWPSVERVQDHHDISMRLRWLDR